MKCKYEITIHNKEIPEDEPIFVLRGRDPLAEQAVIAYSQECAKHGLLKMARETMAVAETMRAYHIKRMPED